MIISSKLIPALTNRSPPSDEVRNLFALPARLGGIAIADPSVESDDYDYSLKITQPLVDAIISTNAPVHRRDEKQLYEE